MERCGKHNIIVNEAKQKNAAYLAVPLLFSSDKAKHLDSIAKAKMGNISFWLVDIRKPRNTATITWKNEGKTRNPLLIIPFKLLICFVLFKFLSSNLVQIC